MTATNNKLITQDIPQVNLTSATKPLWRRLGLALYWVFAIPVMAYGLGMTLLLALRWLIGEQWAIIGYANIFLQFMLVPAPFLFVVSVLLRRRNLALSLVLPTAYLILFYAVFFLPRSVPEVAADAPRLRIMTYNIKADSWSVSRSIDVIRNADADVVAVQELIPQAADLFTKELANDYPYQALHTDPDNHYAGQGVLSRYPIVADEYWTIYRGHQRVELNVDGEQVILYNTHPIQPLTSINAIAMHREEVEAVLARATAEKGRVLLVGDFNMPDQTADYGLITAHFQDTWREVGVRLGYTFPVSRTRFMGGRAIRPFFRLDYIFYNNYFQALSAQVWAHGGSSDHYPLYAELALVDRQSS